MLDINRQQRHFFVVLVLLLTGAFIVTISLSYLMARDSIRKIIIENELPLTGDSIYSEIQRDLIKPVFIADLMAHNTLLHEWVTTGEQDPAQVIRYLAEIKHRYNAFTSFYISESTRRYFGPEGMRHIVNEADPRDRWFFRVRLMKEPYEINLDQDRLNNNLLTFFINFRLVDPQGRFLGVTGIGLSSDAIFTLIDTYQRKFNRHIAFYDLDGNSPFYDKNIQANLPALREIPGLENLSATILNHSPLQTKLSYENPAHNSLIHVNSRYIPELKWYLVISQDEHESLKPVSRALLLNLIIGFFTTLGALALTLWLVVRHERKLVHVAVTDTLTGIANRASGEIKLAQLRERAQASGEPFSIMVIDCDKFKQVNDEYGHLVGDQVIADLAQIIRKNVRAMDYPSRWGGEEFIVLMPQTGFPGAAIRAEALRAATEQHVFCADTLAFSKTVSIGVAQWNGHESNNALFARADVALLRSKEAGRNRVTVDENLSRET